MTALLANRLAVSCDRCGQWFYTDTPLAITAPCPVCDGPLASRGRVRADLTAHHDEERMACNDICQGAKGVSCNCQCGGKNHGHYFTVTVTVEDGKVSMSLDDPTRLEAVRDKNLPLIERSEVLRDEVVALLEVKYADVLVEYRKGGWMPEWIYGPVREWREYRKAVAVAMKYKQPSARVRKLEAMKMEVSR